VERADEKQIDPAEAIVAMDDGGEGQLLPAVGQWLSEQDRGLEVQMDIDLANDDLGRGPPHDREEIDLFGRLVLEQATCRLNAEGSHDPIAQAQERPEPGGRMRQDFLRQTIDVACRAGRQHDQIGVGQVGAGISDRQAALGRQR
jgi:hypothetical protein